MYRLIGLYALFFAPVYAAPVIPNFQQGVLQQHVETKQTIIEDIKSFDIRNGYQLTVGGENVKSNTGNVAPAGWTKVNTTVQGVGTTYVSPDLNNRPTFSIVNEGQSFMYYETLETPGITNFTHITRETTVESISDSTSTFSQ
tara:strand:+ start:220 stop:648 length:429 start_codon:yes stop_codon:yes gene_type:complete